MRSTVRALLPCVVGVCLVAAQGGCGENNEASMAGTKGVAPENAPKSQSDYFKQQKELDKKVIPNSKPRKSR